MAYEFTQEKDEKKGRRAKADNGDQIPESEQSNKSQKDSLGGFFAGEKRGWGGFTLILFPEGL